ncbi:MAG: response regulator, partial [Opitutaceae bacterium]|nr:response regulator [Verrucomicrobiales bacterium]
WTLESGGVRCATTCVQSRTELMEVLERGAFELVLADFSLPGFDGLTALKLVREVSADLPFILVSGRVGEESAIESLTSGATDYVLKNRLSRLVPAVRRAMQEVEHRTERRRAEAAREDYSRKLQVLSRRLVETQETERRHIARELHDEIGQTLTVAQLNLQTLLQQADPGALQNRLRESLDAVDRVLDQVRDISLNLRPSMLDDLGLEPALRWYTNRQAALVGLKVGFLAQPMTQRLESHIETECFRIAQEAMTNVVRHARAGTVTVTLVQSAAWLQLCVKDDGIGFEAMARRQDATSGASLGILSMEERAALAGGGLEIKSGVGHGTEVHAWLPLKWQTGKASSP